VGTKSPYQCINFSFGDVTQLASVGYELIDGWTEMSIYKTDLLISSLAAATFREKIKDITHAYCPYALHTDIIYITVLNNVNVKKLNELYMMSPATWDHTMLPAIRHK